MSSPSPLNIWQLKPWWCQPWSILLTGLTIIGGSWGLLHLRWVTVLVAIPISAWMIFFIGIYPKQMAAILQAEQLSGNSLEKDQENH